MPFSISVDFLQVVMPSTRHTTSPGIQFIPIDDQGSPLTGLRVMVYDERISDAESQATDGITGLARSVGHGAIKLRLVHTSPLTSSGVKQRGRRGACAPAKENEYRNARELA